MLIIPRLLGIWRFSQLGNPEQTLQKVSRYSILLHKLTIAASSHSIGKKKVTSLEEDAPPTKKKKRKNSFSKSNRILPIDSELTLKTLLPMKDPIKPDGEAVNADGSLKPADEIKWMNSPSDELHPSNIGVPRAEYQAAVQYNLQGTVVIEIRNTGPQLERDISQEHLRCQVDEVDLGLVFVSHRVAWHIRVSLMLIFTKQYQTK